MNSALTLAKNPPVARSDARLPQYSSNLHKQPGLRPRASSVEGQNNHSEYVIMI
jgi:hypothetical protein